MCGLSSFTGTVYRTDLHSQIAIIGYVKALLLPQVQVVERALDVKQAFIGDMGVYLGGF